VIFQEAERELVSLVGSGQLSGDNIIGDYTALQLAAGWPVGIKILLDAGADMTRAAKGGELVPWDGGCCNPLRWVIPSDCPASLLVFLRAGAALRPDHIGYVVMHSTPDMVDILMEELIQRRQTLRDLALMALPTSLRNTLGISGNVLPDANVPMVFDALRDAGIPVNESIDPRGPHVQDVGPEYGTIFHQCELDRQLMDRLYDAGFVDVDTVNSAGYSPLMINDSYLSADALIQRADWLVSKGADITRCLPGTSIPAIQVIALRVIWKLEGQLCLNSRDSALSSSSSFETAVFLKQAFTTRLYDGCKCACSPSKGCTSLSVALKELLSVAIWRNGRIPTVLRELLKLAPRTLETAETVIRLATFTDLDLTHTCCREAGILHSGQFLLKPFDPEEADRICDEEGELIAECDQIVARFMKQYQSANLPLMQFMQEYWCPQMQEYLRDGIEFDDGGSIQVHDLGITLSPSARLHSDSLCVLLHPKVTEDGQERGRT
jgi:hypothetical protein